MAREPEESSEAPEPGWRERFWRLGSAARRVVENRAAIFQEELREKTSALGKALASLGIAVLFFVLAGLLLTALLAAVLAKLLGSAVLGILATLVLYVLVGGVAAYVSVRALSRLRPFEFPATRREIDRDLEAVRRAAGVGERRAGGSADESVEPVETGPPEPRRAATAAEMEARLRESGG
jgi:uncharacterized membrane protein YqjE